MDDLKPTQIVLLCLLVSFVTSIGTGIITTSLLREAPQNVTQTINRVVERTVETIVPQSPGVVTREVTVVVKEEDLVIDAINKSKESTVRIFPATGTQQNVVQGLGVVIRNNGTILADKRFIDPQKSYKVMFSTSDETYPVTIAKGADNSNAIFLIPDMKDKPPRNFVPVTLSTEGLQLGQTVIAVGGREKESVAIGRVSSINQTNIESNGTTTPAVSSIEVDTPLRDGLGGSILLNLNGGLVGFENFAPVLGVETLYTAIEALRRENPTFFVQTVS